MINCVFLAGILCVEHVNCHHIIKFSPRGWNIDCKNGETFEKHLDSSEAYHPTKDYVVFDDHVQISSFITISHANDVKFHDSLSNESFHR